MFLSKFCLSQRFPPIRLCLDKLLRTSKLLWSVSSMALALLQQMVFTLSWHTFDWEHLVQQWWVFSAIIYDFTQIISTRLQVDVLHLDLHQMSSFKLGVVHRLLLPTWEPRFLMVLGLACSSMVRLMLQLSCSLLSSLWSLWWHSKQLLHTISFVVIIHNLLPQVFRGLVLNPLHWPLLSRMSLTYFLVHLHMRKESQLMLSPKLVIVLQKLTILPMHSLNPRALQRVTRKFLYLWFGRIVSVKFLKILSPRSSGSGENWLSYDLKLIWVAHYQNWCHGNLNMVKKSENTWITPSEVNQTSRRTGLCAP